MRDRETIARELRLLNAVRRACRELGMTVPSMHRLDALLHERAS
jgi:hypothetical protein